MITYCVLALCGVAFFLEFLGPVILQKFFPQALIAPAPEIVERPKRAFARDAMVDEAMSEVNNPTNPLQANAMLAHVAPASAALASSHGVSSSATEAMLLTGVDPEFDYEDFRTSEQFPGAAMHSEQDALASQALQAQQAQQVEVIQGIPDVFADDETAQHA
jgi:hypothetical protein